MVWVERLILIDPDRILIFGAGVIGSMYAIKFIEAGLEVTLFTQSNRFKSFISLPFVMIDPNQHC